MSDLPTTGVQQLDFLDLSGQELNSMWVDEKQPLFIPNNPLHWKAHKLQIVLQRLEAQASNPKTAQSFNAQSYMRILDDYTQIIEKLKLEHRENADELDQGGLATDGDIQTAQTVGDGVTPGLGVRVSADNPLARRGSDSV